MLILLKFHLEIKHLRSGKIAGLRLKKYSGDFGDIDIFPEFCLLSTNLTPVSLMGLPFVYLLRVSGESGPLYFEVLMLEVNAFSVLQEIPVLKAGFSILPWACPDARFLLPVQMRLFTWGPPLTLSPYSQLSGCLSKRKSFGYGWAMTKRCERRV